MTHRLKVLIEVLLGYVGSIIFTTLILWAFVSDSLGSAFLFGVIGSTIVTPFMEFKKILILLGLDRQTRRSRHELDNMRRLAGLRGRGKISLGDGCSITGSVEGADIYITGDDVTINGEKVSKGKHNKEDLTRDPLGG